MKQRRNEESFAEALVNLVGLVGLGVLIIMAAITILGVASLVGVQ